MLIYLSKEVANKVGILCSEIVEFCDSDTILVNPKEITLNLLDIHMYPYYIDLQSQIYS